MGAGNALLSSLEMIVEVFFDLYLMALMLRFLLQWVKADFYNPLCQLIMRVTNPLLLPLRRFVPGLWGLDIASIVLMFFIKLIEILVLVMMRGHMPSMMILLLIPISLFQTAISVFFFAIVLRAILSWVSPYPGHPIAEVMSQLTEPLLAPIRKKLPPVSGFDLSPLLLLIALQVLSNFLRQWLGV